jgi:hypothetical protein
MNGKLALSDVGEHRAESTNNSTRTAIKHFNKFLEYLDHEYKSFESMSSENFTQALIGRYADYLSKVAKIQSYKSILDYVSSIKTRILKDFPANTNMKDTVWYTNTRSNIKKLSLLQKADDEENNVVSESAKKKEHMGTSMPEDHHSYIGNTLFEKGDRQSMADRCLFALNWTCIGKYHGMLFFRIGDFIMA